MPFAFSSIDPNISGTARGLNLPLNQYYGIKFDMGREEGSGGVAIEHLGGDLTADSDEAPLSPDELNARYGVKDSPVPLIFDKPMGPNRAARIAERHKAETRRLAFISAATNRWFGPRAVSGFAAQMVGSMAHPVDFGLMFVPIIGEAKLAEKMTRIGAAAWRVRMATGLLGTTDSLVKMGVKYPKLTASVIDASVGNAIAEIPVFLRNVSSEQPYGPADSAINIIAGGLFGGGIRLSIDGMVKGFGLAESIYVRMAPNSKAAILKRAMNDLASNKVVDVTDHVRLDEETIKARIESDRKERAVMAEKEVDTKMSDIGAEARARLGLDGSLGRANDLMVRAIAKKLTKNILERGNPSPKERILIRLSERMEAGDKSLETLENAANLLNLILDPTEATMPEFYRAFNRELIEIDASDAARAAGVLELAQRPQKELNTILESIEQAKKAYNKVAQMLAQEEEPLVKTRLRRNRDALLKMQRHWERQLEAVKKTLRQPRPEAMLPMTQAERQSYAAELERRRANDLFKEIVKIRNQRIQETVQRLAQTEMERVKAEAISDQQRMGKIMTDEQVAEVMHKEVPDEAEINRIKEDAATLEKELLQGLDEEQAARFKEEIEADTYKAHIEEVEAAVQCQIATNDKL